MKATLLLVAIFLACTLSIFAADQPELKLKPALDAITPDGLLAHIKVLASDEFEGRAPGTKGEELSVKYISDQFKAIGLNPGNPDGSYTQEVPLTGIKSVLKMSFTLGSNRTELKYPDDYVASSARLQNEIKIDNSDVVFVGYGIVAPEYGWDDYKDVDVRGKTILMLINDPPIPDPKDPSKLDEKMFKGKAMTYYGRWTYKYEIAAQKGAAAAVIIHETEPAAYPYSVVKSSWGKEIFNGAVDNASGDAAVVELARAFSKLNPPPRRSVLFMCTTAEEAGLLGAKFYAEHPLYPLEKTLADLNIDSMNVWGKARDVEDVSFGLSTLDDLLADAAKGQGRTAIPNSRPEKGNIYRADNFEFSKVGLPSLYTGKGEHLLSRPENAPLRSDEFDLHDYHQVTDEVKPDWDLTGAVQDVDLLFEVGYQVANGAKFPEWKPGVEFNRVKGSASHGQETK